MLDTDTSTWPPCVLCAKPAGWSVGWLAPQRRHDDRPCCSSRCANTQRALDLCHCTEASCLTCRTLLQGVARG